MIDKLLKKHSGDKGALVSILQEIQEKKSYLPTELLQNLSEKSSIPLAEIYGVATFYSQFRFIPVGKNLIKVCHGTACHVNNANMVSQTIETELNISDGETTPDSKFTLEKVACLGCCSLAPVMMINDTTYGKLTRDKIKKILKSM